MIRIAAERKEKKKEISKNTQTRKRKEKKNCNFFWVGVLLVALARPSLLALNSRLNAVCECVSARQHGRLIFIVRAIFSSSFFFFFPFSLSLSLSLFLYEINFID